MKQIAIGAAVAALISACIVLAYDRVVVRPAQRVGIVDLSEVYRLKEAQFASLVTGSKSDDERKRALDLAANFARRLPLALEELPRDCTCLVILRSAVAGQAAHTVDLTPLLKTKVGLP